MMKAKADSKNGVKSKVVFKEEILNDPKYNEIFSLFEKMFRRNGLSLKDYFDSEVWFIQNDANITSIYQKKNKSKQGKSKNNKNSLETPTPSQPNHHTNTMLELLQALNESDNSSELQINVKNFIYKVCENLIESHKIISKSEDAIKQYNAHQQVNMINENLKILNERIEKKVNATYVSNLTVSLLKLENFPSGDYEYDLKTVEFSLPGKVDEKKNPLSPNTSNNILKNRTFKLDNSVQIPSDNETVTLNPLKYAFSPLEIRIFENKTFEELFKRHSHSGTTFSNFQLIYLILIYIEDIYDLSKDKLTKSLNLKVFKEEKESENTSTAAIVEFSLEWDDLTRSGILKRVRDIFNKLINSKRVGENNIDEILDDYFSDAETIKNILFRKVEEKRDGCCGCTIF